MSECYRTLLIEDNAGDARLIREMLRSSAGDTFEVETVERLAAALDRLETRAFDAILLDLGLPDSQGLPTFERLRAAAAATPIVVMTGNDDLDLAVRAVQAGAQDYLVKGQVHGILVTRSLRYAVERKRGEAALRESEAKYRTLVETLHEGVWSVDTEARTTYVNPRMAEMLGSTVAEVMARPACDFMDAVGIELAKTYFKRSRRGVAEAHPFEFVRRDGSRIHTIVEVGPTFDVRGGHAGSLAAIRDVTEAHRAEERIHRLNRWYRTVSEVNQLIVRERDVQSLLDAACRILVETGEFCLAWVGVPDIATSRLQRVAAAGATGFLDDVEIRLDDSPEGMGPHGRAYREGLALQLAQDWTTDENVAPWREKGLALGIRSSAAAPIRQGERVFGILTVDAREPNAFEPDVLALLTELADDLGFALCGIEDSKRREAAERATFQSEERFKALAAATFEGIAFTADGVHLDVNEQYAAMFGFKPDELTGRPVLDLVAPQSREAVAAKIRDNLGDASDYFALRKDGSVFPIETRVRAMVLQGRPVMVAAVWDISERRRNEEALRTSEAKYRQLHESMMDGFARVDLRGRILETNATFRSMIGHTDEELCRLSVRELTPERWHASDARVVEQCSRLGYSDAYQKEYRRKDGTIFPVEIRLFLLRGEDGIPTGRWAIVRDVSERVRTEEALRASERKYKHFFEQALAGHYVSTPEGRIIACNGAFARMLGFSSIEDAMVSNLLRRHRSQEVWEQFVHALATEGRVDRLEIEFLRRDGAHVAVIESAVAVRDERGALTEIHGFLLDDTERKKTEGEFRQAQKMEAVGRLAGGVAHDFNNLLSVIIGYAELLQRRLPEHDPVRARLEQIRQAADRGAGLTRQLLAFSRKQVLQPCALDLNQVVRELESMLRRLIGEDVQLVTVLRENLGLVMADRGQVEQVIMNLAVNARDAMLEGGALTIETTHGSGDERFAGRPDAEYFEIVVRDTGCGMDPATLAHIFEPFFTTKGPDKGTGLGLATVYGIVQQSGGQIEVESAPAQGTAFRIRFPLIAGFAPHEERRTKEAPVPGGTETILLLEDDAGLRAMAQETLVLAGYDVLGASCPDEGRALVRTQPGKIDLLLSDVVMPGLNGPEFAAEVTLQRPDVKVLYMSGYTGESIARQRILDTGARLLQKPFTPQALLREVRATIDGPGERRALASAKHEPDGPST